MPSELLLLLFIPAARKGSCKSQGQYHEDISFQFFLSSLFSDWYGLGFYYPSPQWLILSCFITALPRPPI